MESNFGLTVASAATGAVTEKRPVGMIESSPVEIESAATASELTEKETAVPAEAVADLQGQTRHSAGGEAEKRAAAHSNRVSAEVAVTDWKGSARQNEEEGAAVMKVRGKVGVVSMILEFEVAIEV